MSKYVLEVTAPHTPGAPSEDANRLTFALESLAMIHGGKLVDTAGSSPGTTQKRQYVDLLNCETTLDKEVEWLRREFPGAQFTLRRPVPEQSGGGQTESAPRKEP